MGDTMKNKIIVSLLLIFLIAISVSAVSANEDLSDAISETSDIDEDIELTNTDMANAVIISEIDTEDSNEDTEINENIKEDTKLGNFYEGNQNVTVQDLDKFETYVGTGKTYGDGTKFILKDGIPFNLNHAQNLKISCIIEGGTITGSIDNFFTVESPANKGPSSITIRNTKFILQKPNQTILLAKGVTQGINSVLNVAGITLENITIANYVDGATLLNIESSYPNTKLSSALNITNNNLNNIKALTFNGVQMTHDGLNENEIYLPGNEIIFKKQSFIVLNTNGVRTAVDSSVGDSAFTFQLALVDAEGYALVNKTISFAVNAKEYTAKTDEYGVATLKLSLSKAGTYDIFSIFNGDEEYSGSQMVANTLTVNKKDSVLTVKNISYKSTATKKLSATFKDKKGHLIKNKKVTFTVNGKTYTATTNSKGVATVKISLTKKGTYTYKAKFAGDSTYKSITKSAKLTINPVATSLSTKKYTYKKKSKSKKLKVTLKDASGKLLKSKKVTFKVNGKSYTAKTNSKGIATVTIKLTKRGTYKYTAKFAGDSMYKATSKTNKVVIK